MTWISNIIFLLLLTNVSGIILTLIWIIVKQVLKRYGNAGVIHILQRVVLATFLFPVVALYWKFRILMFDETSFLYESTALIRDIFLLVFVLWMAVIAILLLFQIPKLRRLHYETHSKMNATLKEQELLSEICKRYKVKRKIALYKSYRVSSPFVYGMIKQSIYLPERRFSDIELEMILAHEVLHSKHGDTFWKPVFAWMTILLWFNPFQRYMFSEMSRWAEASCDEICCKTYNPKLYFSFMATMAESLDKRIHNYTSAWVESMNEFSWRIHCINVEYRNVKKKHAVTIVMTVIFVLGSCLSLYATNRFIDYMYAIVHKATGGYISVGTVESIDEENLNELEELYGSEKDFKDLVIETDGDYTYDSYITTVDWTIENGVCKESSYIYMRAGDELILQVTGEEDNNLNIGIIQPDDTTRYISHDSIFTYRFVIEMSGDYRIFSENPSEDTAKVCIAYYSNEDKISEINSMNQK